MLCTLWDPIVFTSMAYIKLNHLFQGVRSFHTVRYPYAQNIKHLSHYIYLNLGSFREEMGGHILE